MFTIENLENRFIIRRKYKTLYSHHPKIILNILVLTLSQFIQAAVTEYHKLGGLNKKHLSQFGNSMIKALADLFCGEGLLPV